MLHAPDNIDEALRLLAAPGARCLAGGATLVAMINAGLVEVGDLISLRKIPELCGISRASDDSIHIGAMTRHHDIAISNSFAGGQAVVREAARQIGHPAIRNMGTIGGSIAHADPAADFPTAIVAAAAIVEIIGTEGKREVPAQDFFVDYLQTALISGEIVSAVRIPQAPANSVGIYEKFARTHGDFATVSIGLVMSMHQAVCASARLAVGGCDAHPIRVPAAEELLVGTKLAPEVVAEAGAMLADASSPVDDMRGSAEYRQMLIPVLVERALMRARIQAEKNE
jgi:carbon-monoxide dehydrogenase medium subunit